MKHRVRALSYITLVFGLAASGALTLAVTTDFWLVTTEPFKPDNMTDDLTWVNVTSGLWRLCFPIEQLQYVNDTGANKLTSESKEQESK